MSAMSLRSTPRSRDRHRLAVAAVTGAATVVSLTATGLVVGVATADFEATQAEREAAQARAERQRARYDRQVARAKTAASSTEPVALRERLTRTRVTTRYVTLEADQSVGGGELRTSTQPPSAAASNSGPGTATNSNSGPGSNTSGSSSAPPPPPPPPTPPAPPPPPPPPPAPTSGS
jgi:hypothetical protein